MPEHTVLDHVDEYLKLGREYGSSDLHLATAYPPAWRLNGVLGAIWPDHEPLKPAETEKLVRSFLGEKGWSRLDERGDIDFAYEGSDGRYRASIVKQRLGYDMVFRIINSEIRSMEDIGLPIEHIIPLTRYQNGLILVTGSVGSGKSTSLASIVDFINQDREDHILTLEDPIEYVFDSKGCHVNQREVHKHTESFARALRGALREDPDVIMVGEMRDLETIQLALTAAETGHLVLGTLHTGNAPRTLDRVLDVFPTDQREQIRIMVSESLRGILSQQLIPNVEGDGRVLATELLVNTPAVANCIREGKTYMLPGVMQTGKHVGMITMDESLRKLYIKGKITSEELLFRSDDKAQMKSFLNS
ncbi:MAG: type IV pilus twitching motility protein PilT [Akkermansiaceae bacterium]|nr:type IV pilus twitching motility protein PilT [Akkermansiaceae bacterium]